MKIKMLIITTIFSGFILSFGNRLCFAQTLDINDHHNKAGGQCDYANYEGTAKIVSVTDKDIKGFDEKHYEVKFSFYTHQTILQAFAQKTKDRLYTLTLDGKTLFTKEFIEQKGIEVESEFNCYMQVIIKGTCTPIIFYFPDISQI